MAKGKHPRFSSKASKSILSLKGSLFPLTARRLAQKQPPFKESVTAHWLRKGAPKIYRGLNIVPKTKIPELVSGVVGERSVCSEGVP